MMQPTNPPIAVPPPGSSPVPMPAPNAPTTLQPAHAAAHPATTWLAVRSGLLDVAIEMSSADTGDQERDDTLKGADLFAVAKFPQAHFAASQINRTAAGYEAVGKLTIRGVTRDASVPFSFRTVTENGAAVGYMSGKTSVRRLDYGVGQGDWKATDQVGNDVAVSFALRLIAH